MCISHKVGCRMYAGRFDREAERFLPQRHIRMNWPGGKFFAADSLLDDQGRRVYWAWVTDVRLAATRARTGAGFQSLPRILSMDAAGEFTFAPAPELAALRRNERAIAPRELPANAAVMLDGVAGDSLELELEIQPQAAQRVGLIVYASRDGREETTIWYDPCTGLVSIDASKSSLRTDLAYCWGPLDALCGGSCEHLARHPVTAAPLSLAAGEPLRLRVFLDGPLLEVFANGRQCLTQVVYPSLGASRLVKLLATASPARLLGGKAHDLAAARFIDQR